MSRKEKDDFNYEIDKNFDHIIDEGANTSIILRRISWNGNPFKVDLRKYRYEDGKEIMGKGVSLTDEAADTLTETLAENGYGNTKKILKGIKDREDYIESLNTIDEPDNFSDNGEEEYYDPQELLGGNEDE